MCRKPWQTGGEEGRRTAVVRYRQSGGTRTDLSPGAGDQGAITPAMMGFVVFETPRQAQPGVIMARAAGSGGARGVLRRQNPTRWRATRSSGGPLSTR